MDPLQNRTPAATAHRPATAIPGPPLGPDEHVPVPGTLTFDEVLQALNPLHHLPVIGTIYRATTGATLNPALRILGGAALGGPVGLLTTAVFTAIEELGKAGQASATAQGTATPGTVTPRTATQGSATHG